MRPGMGFELKLRQPVIPYVCSPSLKGVWPPVCSSCPAPWPTHARYHFLPLAMFPRILISRLTISLPSSIPRPRWRGLVVQLKLLRIHLSDWAKHTSE